MRMAARSGAKIVPFGVVGEDDFGQVHVILLPFLNKNEFIKYFHYFVYYYIIT